MTEQAKPVPPPGRLVCEACGELVDGKHTNWMCQFLGWLDRRRKQ